MTSRPSVISALEAPATWSAIPVDPGHDGSWTDDVARALGEGAAVRADLADVLRRTHDAVVAVPHLATAVWVPDPRLGVIAGLLTVDRLVPPPGTRASRDGYYETITSGHEDRDALVREIHAVDVPAGPAVRVREIAAPTAIESPSGRTVTRSVVYTVFPPEGFDALQLAFVTAAPARAGDLEADAEVTVHTLRLVTIDADEERSDGG